MPYTLLIFPIFRATLPKSEHPNSNRRQWQWTFSQRICQLPMIPCLLWWRNFPLKWIMSMTQPRNGMSGTVGEGGIQPHEIMIIGVIHLLLYFPHNHLGH